MPTISRRARRVATRFRYVLSAAGILLTCGPAYAPPGETELIRRQLRDQYALEADDGTAAERAQRLAKLVEWAVARENTVNRQHPVTYHPGRYMSAAYSILETELPLLASSPAASLSVAQSLSRWLAPGAERYPAWPARHFRTLAAVGEAVRGAGDGVSETQFRDGFAAVWTRMQYLEVPVATMREELDRWRASARERYSREGLGFLLDYVGAADPTRTSGLDGRVSGLFHVLSPEDQAEMLTTVERQLRASGRLSGRLGTIQALRAEIRHPASPTARNVGNRFGLTAGATGPALNAAVEAAIAHYDGWPPVLDREQQQRLLEFCRLVTENPEAARQVPRKLLLKLGQSIAGTADTPFIVGSVVGLPSSHGGTVSMRTALREQAGKLLGLAPAGAGGLDDFLETLRVLSFRADSEHLQTYVLPALWDGNRFLYRELYGEAPDHLRRRAEYGLDTSEHRTFTSAFGPTLAAAERADAKPGAPPVIPPPTKPGTPVAARAAAPSGEGGGCRSVLHEMVTDPVVVATAGIGAVVLAGAGYLLYDASVQRAETRRLLEEQRERERRERDARPQRP